MASKPLSGFDRAKGALVGLAVGDAVGTTLEFKLRDSYPLLTVDRRAKGTPLSG